MPPPLLPPRCRSALRLSFPPKDVSNIHFPSLTRVTHPGVEREHRVYIWPGPTSPFSRSPRAAILAGPGWLHLLLWLAPGGLGLCLDEQPNHMSQAEHLESFQLWRGFGKVLVSRPSSFSSLCSYEFKGK